MNIKDKIQEYDGYKIPSPRNFSKQELEEWEKEKKEKIKKIISENPHLSNS